MAYREEEFLQLSGVQHFKFCRRRWALIHVENQWEENYHTIDGELMHQHAHDGDFRESRGDVIITRAMPVFSHTLGVSGQCDVLEFYREANGISLAGQEGLWRPFPIEYKRGKPNPQAGEVLQLCGQAMCLEEMLTCEIPEGALYYGELRRRYPVEFTKEIRQEVKDCLEEMHQLYRRGRTPKVKPKKGCSACSLREICLPKLMSTPTVAQYLADHLEETP